MLLLVEKCREDSPGEFVRPHRDEVHNDGMGFNNISSNTICNTDVCITITMVYKI